MNITILTGNLTRDPESGTTNSGKSFCNFGIAVNRNYTNADGERQTDFFHVKTWRGLAENCSKYLKKGSKVLVEGCLQNRTYEDREGTKRTVTEIIADNVEFLSSKGGSHGSDEAPPPEDDGYYPDDDPFPPF